MDDVKSLWTVNDLAEAADLTPQRVRQLLGEGEIAGEKIGRMWVVPREEALRFIETHEKYKQTPKEEEPEQNDDEC